MNTFVFTDTQDVKSKAVDTLTYNENTRELVIDWHNDLYKYDGVPPETYKAVVAGTYKNGLTDASVGRAAQRVKKDFGPGKYLGVFGAVKFTPEAKAKRTAVPSYSLSPSATASPAKVTNVGSEATNKKFSLTPSPAVTKAGKSTTYTVDFKANGETREYTAKDATSVDEAVAAINEVAEMLGVELTVTGVYVDFE